MSTPTPAPIPPHTPTYPQDYTYAVTTATRMAPRNLVPRTVTAEWLFDQLPEDGSIAVVWQGFGHVHGVERFSTHMMRRSIDGRAVEVLRTSPGSRTHLEPIVIYPLGNGRVVRTFVVRAD